MNLQPETKAPAAAAVLARCGAKLVQLTYFDGFRAAEADVTKLVELVGAILADQ